MAIIGADTSGLQKSINEAKSVLDKYTKEAKNSGSQIKTVTESQVASYQRVVKVLDKVASGTLSTKQQEKALASQIKELKIQWANLSDEAKRGDFGKSLSASCKTAQAQLKQLQAQLGQVKGEMKQVGNTPMGGFNFKGFALQGAAMATGIGSVMAGATLAVDALKKGVTTTMEFNKAQSTLQAVTGKSASELALLTDQALELGSKTRYSASEIAGLQIELAKLGFDPTQIKQMTEHIQNFATAVGTDLSSAASLAGATLRMFGLDASESQRVADVLSKSCSASALSFEYLNSGMSTIGPVANSFGLSLEDVTGLLGVLANAGFDASSAATAGRNIILNLADANGKLAQALGRPVKSGTELMDALKVLRDREIDLGEALELTDKRSVAAFNTLLDGSESGKELIATLQDCNGAAKEMSDTMSDNLEGDLAGLNSAWEGLMLSLGGGQSVFRNVVQWLTSLIGTINENCKAIAEWATDFYNNSAIVRGILQTLVLGFKNTFNSLVFIVKNAMNNIKAFFVILSKVLTGDFEGAVKAWKDALTKNVKNTKEFASQFKKNVEGAFNETINGKITVNQKVETNTTTTEQNTNNKKDTTNTSTKNKGGKTSGKSGKGGKGGKSTTTSKPVYKEGSIGKIESDISNLQAKLKLAISDKDRQEIQKQILELTKQKEAIELSLKAKPDEGSIKAIDDAISEKQKELNLAVSDTSRANIQKEINTLTEQKRVMELKIKPVVDDDAIEGLNEKLSEHQKKVSEKKSTIKTKVTEVEQASSNVESIKEELSFQESVIKTYKKQYQAIQEKIKLGTVLTGNEQKLVSVYDQAKDKVDALSESYKQASANAQQLQANANFKDKMYSGIKGTVDNLGNLNNSIQNVEGTWGSLMDNWGDMSTFEQITNSIGAVISTIQEVIGAYESIMSIIELFGEISEASSAKKIAADSAEMAMDSAKTATETANTEVKIANDTAENTSTMGKLGIKEADAIAGATQSGASLPFPANIAAIAAGIAAVIAGFAMVFSCFADGGIVGGNTTIGDYNLCRLNKGEMVLNGTQQARLFNMLDSGSGGNMNVGVIPSTIKIKGSDIYIALRNLGKTNPNGIKL